VGEDEAAQIIRGVAKCVKLRWQKSKFGFEGQFKDVVKFEKKKTRLSESVVAV
jgi:hypothetical protein